MNTRSHRTDPESILHNRDFRVLLATQGVSSLGDAVSVTAMPLLVLALTGSGLAMALVSALHFLPDLIVGMVAGAIADRADRKRMMFLADLGRAGLTALIPLSVMVGGPTMVVILVVAIPLSVLRSFFMAGYTAAVPDLVGRSQIARANSLLEAIYSLGYIAGPAIAGILASSIGPGPTLAIDAASFAMSGLGLRLLRRELRSNDTRQEKDVLKEVREGIDFVRQHPILRSAILYWGITAIISASFVTALAVHITRDLELSATVLGFILTGYGIGTVAGALIMARIGDRRSVAPWLIGGNLVLAAAFVAIANIVVIPALIAMATLGGIAQSVVFVTYVTMRTAYSPDALMARIGSTARVISFGMQPVGLLAGGVVIDLTSGSTAIGLMGGGLAAVTLPFMASSALRRARSRPSRREVERHSPQPTRVTADDVAATTGDAARVADNEGS